MRKRTEEEKIRMAPLEVSFGDKKYGLKPLPITKNREWAQKLTDFVGQLMDAQPTPTESSDPATVVGVFRSGVTRALTLTPEKLTELIFLYSPDLPREEIMASASEEQIQEAFSGLFEMAFPHLAELGRLTQVAKAGMSVPSARFVN